MYTELLYSISVSYSREFICVNLHALISLYLHASVCMLMHISSYIHVYTFTKPRGSSTVLLGDTIHTVKPYFGLGLNSALEDVRYLEEALADSKGTCICV